MSVVRVLEDRGHQVTHGVYALARGTPDQVVAAASETMGAILVSFDKDFRRIAPRIPSGHRRRFRGLSRIALNCDEPSAAHRVKAAISLVESEYVIAQSNRDQRMIVVIGKSYIRTER